MTTNTNTLKTSAVATLCALSLMAGGVATASAHACEADLAADTTTTTTDTRTVHAMNRLYNPYTGEHFYTADTDEKATLVEAGWNDEGIGWYAPATSNTPVYRLYNKFAPGGDHHYTMDKAEYDWLVKLGWSGEGVGWYSDDDKQVALLRQYNPNELANNHNFTTSTDENKTLIKAGWQAEGEAWYGVTHKHNWVTETIEHPAVTHTEEQIEWYEPGIYCLKHKVKCYEGVKWERWLGHCPDDPTCLAAQTRIEEHEKIKSRKTVTIVDKEAWSENKIVCSECGDIK